MSRLWIGIDNGLSGGIAMLDETGKFRLLAPMPTTKNGKGRDLDVELLKGALIHGLNDEVTVVIELPTKHSPGVLALCSTWCCYGGIRAVLKLSKVRTHEITSPRTWQKIFWTVPKMPKGQKFDTKAAALKAANQLWPEQKWLATDRSSVPHNGLVDAALIAEYGRRNNL